MIFRGLKTTYEIKLLYRKGIIGLSIRTRLEKNTSWNIRAKFHWLFFFCFGQPMISSLITDVFNLQAFASILIMFLINWGYALANISLALLVYIYIGQANPGLSKGRPGFSFVMQKWIILKICCPKNRMPYSTLFQCGQISIFFNHLT